MISDKPAQKFKLSLSSTFFSAAMAETRVEVDFLGLYIPANPFHALANNLVPAVVLFSIALGVALIGVDKKDSMLDGMTLIIDLLTRIANFVVRLTPIGVFAIMASASGTLSFAEFVRLEVYIYSYIALSLVMSLWVLPGMVTALTPLSYRDVVGSTKDALVTAFATGSLFVVLPILMEKSKELITRYAENKEAAESAVEVIVPASFNFPHAGKLFTLSFVLFAGWFSGYSVEVKDYPLLVGTGLASLFANVNLAVPFMLDIMRIPGDLYQLFITTGNTEQHYRRDKIVSQGMEGVCGDIEAQEINLDPCLGHGSTEKRRTLPVREGIREQKYNSERDAPQ